MITDYHAKLFAHELSRRCSSDSVERFTAALMDSMVDLNPHQVDAALFAFRSPLSKGAILADEVGLGKTTATPLQNSLVELYGLVSFIDEHTFGDLKSYRSQFVRLTSDDSFDDLKHRLNIIFKRTLRRQVLEYIQYTERKAYTQGFFPSKEEEVLYNLVSEYSSSERKISILEPLIGRSGILIAKRLTVRALDVEDYIIAAAITDQGNELDSDQARRLFNIPAIIMSGSPLSGDDANSTYIRYKNRVLDDISQRNAVFFEEDMEKLNRLAEDRRKSLKTSLKEFDDQIAELKKQARIAPNLPEKLEIQKKIRDLDKKRDDACREYDRAAKEVELQKDALIEKIEARLQQDIEEETLFTIRWKLI